MIIGLSGKKQHGKDTVCKMIQWFTTPSEQPLWNNNLLSFLDSDHIGFEWERKQFASKLKQIVCLLIGCTLKQLENNKFKETFLGEEWDKPLTGVTRLLYSDEYYRENIAYSRMNPRKLLQLIGTEAGRKLIHPNIWVNSLMADYKLIPNPNGILRNMVYPKWIITDVRFPNELKAIEAVGGVVLRVSRLNTTVTDMHESETALDDHPWTQDQIITNTTLEDLAIQVQQKLKQLNIIP